MEYCCKILAEQIIIYVIIINVRITSPPLHIIILYTHTEPFDKYTTLQTLQMNHHTKRYFPEKKQILFLAGQREKKTYYWNFFFFFILKGYR